MYIPSSTIVPSGDKSNSSPRYAYEYYYDSSVVSKKSQATVVILFVVGTAMTCTAYSDLAANCVSGQSTVWVTVDNNPGGITNPAGGVKLYAGKTADAFNDIKASIDERFGDIVSSN